jgi:methionyl-tRNA formyltransferase
MKIILACSADYMAIPAAIRLKDANMLAGVVIPGKLKDRLLPAFLQAGFEKGSIHTVNRDTLEDTFISLVQAYNASCVFVITFPWRIPAAALAAPVYGFINFHPGLMPAYKGADPIFWQLKNREQFGGITVHQMTEVLDEGPILVMQQIPFIPGETYGMHHVRLGVLAAEMVLNIAEYVEQGKNGEVQNDTQHPRFFNKPERGHVTINWTSQSAAEIEATVNAANPKYNGALTRIGNTELSLLDVAFADIADAPKGIVPGTIVYSDAVYGPIVACADGHFLRINTACMTEGYVSGSKLFSMGFGVGQRFL